MKVLTIVGNRPQFIKLGVTARALRRMGAHAPFENVVVNTGQHYDQMLSDVFFSELEIEPPKYDLGIGSGHITDQIGKMLSPMREIFEQEEPDALLVYGDTNSTIAGALVAAHLAVPIIHVEGGERLYRRIAMPEETNRVVTDHLSSLCLASSRKALDYLYREGFAQDRAIFVGDPMYDIFKLSGEMLKKRKARQPSDFGLVEGRYTMCTIHRAENTDAKEICLGLLDALDGAPQPVLLPAHPRLLHRLDTWGWAPTGSLRLIDPLGYFDFQSLLRKSSLVVTDSGGVGREAFFARKPAIVPLESSAWIEAVEAGMAVMTGRSPDQLTAALADAIQPRDIQPLIEANFGAGDAGEKIVAEVAQFVGELAPGTEAQWHSIDRFENLPRAIDSSLLSPASLAATMKAVAAANEATAYVDITIDHRGASHILAAARSAGADAALLFDPARAAYNFFERDTRAAIAQLSKAGHAIAAPDEAGRALLAYVFGNASVVDPSGLTADLDASGTPRDLAECVSSDAAKSVVLRAHLWCAEPVSPFEAHLRALDRHHQSRLADIDRAQGKA